MDSLALNLKYTLGTDCTKMELASNNDEFDVFPSTAFLNSITLKHTFNGVTTEVPFTSNIIDAQFDAEVESGVSTMLNVSDMSKVSINNLVLIPQEVGGIIVGYSIHKILSINTGTSSIYLTSAVAGSYSPAIVLPIYTLSTNFNMLATYLSLEYFPDGVHDFEWILNYYDTTDGEYKDKVISFTYPYFCNARCCVAGNLAKINIDNECNINISDTMLTLKAWANIKALEYSICCNKVSDYHKILASLEKYCELVNCQPCNCN